MKTRTVIFVVALALAAGLSSAAFAQDPMGGSGLQGLTQLSDAESRSISPENFTGGKGAGGMAEFALPSTRNVNSSSYYSREHGTGWKINPSIVINSGETFTIADIEGPGEINHFWMTPTGNWRMSILRIYWDGEDTPSVECSLGDFFCMGWCEYAPVVSAPICVNPGSAFNSYWQMPFRKRCRMTVENVDPDAAMTLFYQIDYSLKSIDKKAPYFHAQFRRTRYNETSDFVAIDGIKGQGHYVGIYLAWGVTNTGWWGEGEFKFFIDGDSKYPTICGTGVEDYFLGSYCYLVNGKYETYTTPYAGFFQITKMDPQFPSVERFGMYRWHILDPIRFKKDLKITIQDLGWHKGGRFLKQHSDIAATVFWYQSEPHAAFPEFPSWEELECL